jgi:hypothetical protein
MERIWPSDWSVPSFDEALSRITEAGLAYDVGARTGVVLSSAFDRHEQAIVHVIVAEDLDAAWDRQARMTELFSGA